ncbi:MAG: hypothetical protein IT379_36710 [Deltaproteobacteria bacterium]|nr:hypothetical protein [Deltaproteobacteria bacterium]
MTTLAHRVGPAAGGAIACMFVACAACSPRYLPPPATPSRSVPSVSLPPTPPPPGHGRAVIDVLDGPADVEVAVGERRYGDSAAAPAGRWLCRAPCVVDLSNGSHELLLRLEIDGTEYLDSGVVEVGPVPVVYRRAMRLEHRPSPWPFAIVLGLSAGAFYTAIDAFTSDRLGVGATGGVVSLAIGTGLLGLSVYLGVRAIPEIREGREAQYPL